MIRSEPAEGVLSGCLHSDPRAWEALIRAYSHRLYFLSYRYTHSHQDAEDMTQEIFLRIYRMLKTYRAGEGSLSSWILKVGRNLLVDHYRKTKRNVQYVCDGDAAARSRMDNRVRGPQCALEREEARRIVGRALRMLPRRSRQVIILRDIEGMGYPAIADALGVPVGTIKSRVSRAREEMAAAVSRQARRTTGRAARDPLRSAGSSVQP